MKYLEATFLPLHPISLGISQIKQSPLLITRAHSNLSLEYIYLSDGVVEIKSKVPRDLLEGLRRNLPKHDLTGSVGLEVILMQFKMEILSPAQSTHEAQRLHGTHSNKPLGVAANPAPPHPICEPILSIDSWRVCYTTSPVSGRFFPDKRGGYNPEIHYPPASKHPVFQYLLEAFVHLQQPSDQVPLIPLYPQPSITSIPAIPIVNNMDIVPDGNPCSNTERCDAVGTEAGVKPEAAKILTEKSLPSERENTNAIITDIAHIYQAETPQSPRFSLADLAVFSSTTPLRAARTTTDDGLTNISKDKMLSNQSIKEGININHPHPSNRIGNHTTREASCTESTRMSDNCMEVQHGRVDGSHREAASNYHDKDSEGKESRMYHNNLVSSRISSASSTTTCTNLDADNHKGVIHLDQDEDIDLERVIDMTTRPFSQSSQRIKKSRTRNDETTSIGHERIPKAKGSKRSQVDIEEVKASAKNKETRDKGKEKGGNNNNELMELGTESGVTSGIRLGHETQINVKATGAAAEEQAQHDHIVGRGVISKTEEAVIGEGNRERQGRTGEMGIKKGKVGKIKVSKSVDGDEVDNILGDIIGKWKKTEVSAIEYSKMAMDLLLDEGDKGEGHVDTSSEVKTGKKRGRPHTGRKSKDMTNDIEDEETTLHQPTKKRRKTGEDIEGGKEKKDQNEDIIADKRGKVGNDPGRSVDLDTGDYMSSKKRVKNQDFDIMDILGD